MISIYELMDFDSDVTVKYLPRDIDDEGTLGFAHCDDPNDDIDGALKENRFTDGKEDGKPIGEPFTNSDNNLKNTLATPKLSTPGTSNVNQPTGNSGSR